MPELPTILIRKVPRRNRTFWRATFPAHPDRDLRGHIECNSLTVLRAALDLVAETYGYAVAVQEETDA